MFSRFLKKEYIPIILLFALVILSITITLIYAITLRHELKTSATDGLAFAQVIFNFINGRGLTSTIPPPYIEQSWLGIHFSPILYAIAPLYYLFPHIETLLFLHSFFIALAAVPIFFVSKILLGSQWQALVISIFYLINPFVVNAQIWDFHEIAFAPLILTFILWAVLTKKRAWLVFFCAILLTIKEHYGLAVFGTGLLWAWHWRDPKFGLALAALGLITFIAVIKIIMPYFSPIGAAIMLSENSEINRFSWLAHPLQDKEMLIKTIVNAVFYMILLLFYLWFLPIFSIAWLFPAIADGLVNILSNNDMMRHPLSYHTAALIPILLIAYTKTIATRYDKNTRLKRWEIMAATALMTVAFSYNFISLPIFINNLWEFSTPRFSLSEENGVTQREILKIIGKHSSVSAQTNILTHITVRQNMYMFPHGIEQSEYIIINTTIPFTNKSNVFGIPYYGENTNKYFTASYRIMADKNWGVAYYKNNWLLFKRSGENNQALHDSAKKDLQELQIKYHSLIIKSSL